MGGLCQQLITAVCTETDRKLENREEGGKETHTHSCTEVHTCIYFQLKQRKVVCVIRKLHNANGK